MNRIYADNPWYIAMTSNWFVAIWAMMNCWFTASVTIVLSEFRKIKKNNLLLDDRSCTPVEHRIGSLLPSYVLPALRKSAIVADSAA